MFYINHDWYHSNVFKSFVPSSSCKCKWSYLLNLIIVTKISHQLDQAYNVEFTHEHPRGWITAPLSTIDPICHMTVHVSFILYFYHIHIIFLSNNAIVTISQFLRMNGKMYMWQPNTYSHNIGSWSMRVDQVTLYVKWDSWLSSTCYVHCIITTCNR